MVNPILIGLLILLDYLMLNFVAIGLGTAEIIACFIVIVLHIIWLFLLIYFGVRKRNR
jgi:hypothetical protein